VVLSAFLQESAQPSGFAQKSGQVDNQKRYSGQVDECQPVYGVTGGLHPSFCVSDDLRMAAGANAFLPSRIRRNGPQTGDCFE
jgi:hypothetical protein